MKKTKPTQLNEQILQKIIPNCISYSEVFRQLGMVPDGANYRTLHKYVKLWNIDVSHIEARTWHKHISNGRGRPLEEILVKGRFETGHILKKRLIAAGIKKHACEGCGLTEWRGKSIPLEVHHKDGDRNNNLLVSLVMKKTEKQKFLGHPVKNFNQ